ncbi:MAG: isoprenylcysteine carboxylmethyltransferase family protein [Candidatus Bathyarchaeota archaeon]|nr:MAG: isoprenylcysteine carboxylmethyltransferase family protein [Candidatus Bathyarchaeota archaeon]
MYFWFIFCIAAAVAVVPLHFVSVEHLTLRERFGMKRGRGIGEILGYVSGWGFFISWIGIWFSPQPRFVTPLLHQSLVAVPVVMLPIPLLHILVSAPFLTLGAWFGINGVKEVTLRVAETHRTERIISTGTYSIIRHPQYLGALLAHFGMSFLLSAWFSLISTPLLMILVYMISKKEEKELVREFGCEYEAYQKNVPMLTPRLC